MIFSDSVSGLSKLDELMFTAAKFWKITLLLKLSTPFSNLFVFLFNLSENIINWEHYS